MELLGVVEIAELLAVSRQRVDELSRTAGFPAPAADLEAGRIWRRADVEAWAQAAGRPLAGTAPTRPAKCIGGPAEGVTFATDAEVGSTVTPPGADDVMYLVTDDELDGGYVALVYRGPADQDGDDS